MPSRFPSLRLTCKLSIHYFFTTGCIVSWWTRGYEGLHTFDFFPSNSATNDLRVFGENRYERKSSGAGRRCLSESCMVVQIQGKYHDSGSWSSTKTFDDQSTKLTQTCLFCMLFCDRPPDLPAQNRTEDPAKKYIFNTHFIIQQNRVELLQEKLEKAESQHDITLRGPAMKSTPTTW